MQNLSQKAPSFVILTILGVCFILPPLFHLNLKPNDLAPGFIPLRIINADLKFLIVFGCMSMITGILFVYAHLRGNYRKIPKSVLLFGSIFLLSVFVSTVISHNPMRAWVSSLQWHIVPLFFVLCLSQLQWSRGFLISVVGLLIAGGVASCLVTLDQHYYWTDWSHRLVRNGYAGIIFNRNFAAEYHAPLIPLTFGFVFYLRNWMARCFCLVVIFCIFLPAVSLSTARGAWVGHLGGALGVVILFFLVTKILPKQESDSQTKQLSQKGYGVLALFICLGLLLPGYLYTSDFWKKGGVGWDRLKSKETSENYQIVEKDSPAVAKTVPKATPVLVDTIESRELETITKIKDSASSQRRLVLWEDAIKECFSKDFLLGKGTDHYELFYHESAELSDKNWGKTLVRFVHNDFIQTFYENGILGIVGWIGVWSIICWQGLVACIWFFRSGNTGELGIRLGLIACILCFLIESFFEFPTRSPCAMFVGWSALGVLLGLNLQQASEDKEKVSLDLRKKPVFNLMIGVVGVALPFYAAFLIKDLFWANVYHFQGRAAADAKKPQLSLHFHRESISHAPWQHLSRKAEGFLLITQEKRFLDAMKSIEETLRVHPGCLQAHQNRIALLINEFKNPNAAKLALLDMKKAAPFHPFTRTEENKLRKLFNKQ
jgi:hypothetical protein